MRKRTSASRARKLTNNPGSVEDYGGLNAGYVSDLAETKRKVTNYQRGDNTANSRRDGYGEFDLYGLDIKALANDPVLLTRVMAYVSAVRDNGYREANLDPLELQPKPKSQLNISDFSIPQELLSYPIGELPGVYREVLPNGTNDTVGDYINHLRRVYTRTVGYEFSHIRDSKIKNWLNSRVERRSATVDTSEQNLMYIYRRLLMSEKFEQFLHKAYPGQIWFSLEGLESSILMTDQIMLESYHSGIKRAVVAMAHRGRLNFLAHVVGKPYQLIISEFAGLNTTQLIALRQRGWMTDVKYHLGAQYARDWNHDGQVDVHIDMLPNPSHLEMVNPTALGFTRAIMDRTGEDILPLLVHGDAAFGAQGVVAESLNLAQIPAYNVGGTVHMVLNNQIGFTTGPAEQYSGESAVDLARAYDIPLVHVNADDVLSCLMVAKLAVEYRQKFNKDFLINLIGYRRYGHNEVDDASMTQPLMARKISQHPTIHTLYKNYLIDKSLITEEKARQDEDSYMENLLNIKDKVSSVSEEQELKTAPDLGSHMTRWPSLNEIETKVSLTNLRKVNKQISEPPAKFKLHPNVAKQFTERVAKFSKDHKINWGHAEMLAYGTLAAEGCPLRLTGQDSQRGTFSQRHAVLFDYETGKSWHPLQEINPDTRSEVFNSPLSEVATLGYEYGYSVNSPETLVIWEAQYGDFVNNAQGLVDEFIVSGNAKWGQESSVVLFLPHGYEGQGPNHSSAHLERFLALSARGNTRIVCPTTAAQMFHLLRSHAKGSLEINRPMIVVTGKSLLRHPLALSPVSDLVEGRFKSIRRHLPPDQNPKKIKRAILCTGKIYVDLLNSPLLKEATDTALICLEELYPVPYDEIKAQWDLLPNVKELIWLQEEPRNRGAWTFVSGGRIDAYLPDGIRMEYIGRPANSSPAEAVRWLHKMGQDALIKKALTGK